MKNVLIKTIAKSILVPIEAMANLSKSFTLHLSVRIKELWFFHAWYVCCSIIVNVVELCSQSLLGNIHVSQQ